MILLVALGAQQPDFEPLYRQALAQRENDLGPESPKTRESARDLALYLAARGDTAGAARYVPQVLATVRTVEAALAERLYRQALEIRSRALPSLDVDLATTRLNLAGLLLSRGDPEAARLAPAAMAALEKGLAPMDERLGAASGLMGAILADLLSQTGRELAARPLLQRAQAIRAGSR